MAPNSITKFMKNAQNTVVKYGPQISMAVGITGMITATVLAVKATPKAMEKIEEKKEELGVEKLTPVDTVKATWKCYIPTAATTVISTGFLIGSCAESTKRTAAMAAAYKVLETASHEFREVVEETVDKEQVQVIRERSAEKHLANNPVQELYIEQTGLGTDLICDEFSGRYFRASMFAIENAESKMNLDMRNMDYCSLNSFYSYLNLEHSDMGRLLGWNINRHGFIDIHKTAKIASNGEPCIVISYSDMPEYEFDSYM